MRLESQPAQAAQKAFPASLPSPAQARSPSRSPTPDQLEPGDGPTTCSTTCSGEPAPDAPSKHVFSPLLGDLSVDLLSLLGQALSCFKITGKGERQRETEIDRGTDGGGGGEALRDREEEGKQGIRAGEG